MASESPRILFVGDAWLGSNARSLANGFAALGASIFAIDTSQISRPTRGSKSWAYRKATGRALPTDLLKLKIRIEEAVRSFNPDILFCVKTIHLDQDHLLDLAVPLKVHYSADDVTNPYNTTAEYLLHEPRWDLVVTTKIFNVPELLGRGAKQAMFVYSAYDPSWHFRTPRRTLDQYSVGFIGNLRPDRVELVRSIGHVYGGMALVAGPGWKRERSLAQAGVEVRGPRYGVEFSETISEIRANLVLLNSDNRDTHTCRSFEVPAAGGLVVAERTEEHAELFDEGSEAVLFSNQAELFELLQRIEAEPDVFKKVALNGFRRITESGAHTYRARAGEIVKALA